MNENRLRNLIEKLCVYLTLLSFLPLCMLFVYIIAFVGYQLVIGFFGNIQQDLVTKWVVFSLICGIFPLIIAAINDRYKKK